ncbi:hypothetical protein NC651_029838 [Populus alba x Populus x berolinensis]|nr:hypothetical protein NC651_029838 [Populus alba x Populus x berolinensis]
MEKAQTKAAAQALARLMSHQTADDDDNIEDGYLSYDYQLSGMGSTGPAARVHVPAKTYQPAQVPAPAKADQPVEEDSGAPAKTNQPAQARVPAKTYQPVDEDSDHDELYMIMAPDLVVRTGRPEQPPSTHSSTSSRSSLSVNTVEQPSSAQISSAAPPSHPTNSVEQPISSRSTMVGMTTLQFHGPASTCLGVKTVPMPSSVPRSLRPASPMVSSDNPKDKMYHEAKPAYIHLEEL